MVAFPPVGLLESASWDETVRLVDLLTSAARATCKGHTVVGQRTIVFSPNAQLLTLISHNNTAMLRDLKMIERIPWSSFPRGSSIKSFIICSRRCRAKSVV
jgi:WD40 repeat protein